MLSRAGCAVLTNLLDSKWREKPCADLKLPLSLAELAELIGQNSADRLAALVSGDFDKILLRRCSATKERLCIGFHLDVSQQVLQVALNDDSEYSGGRLMFLTGKKGEGIGEGGGGGEGEGEGGGGRLVVPKRSAGSFTIHNCHVVHGVSELRAGLRYGLFFIKEGRKENERDQNPSQQEEPSPHESSRSGSFAKWFSKPVVYNFFLSSRWRKIKDFICLFQCQMHMVKWPMQ